MAVDCAVDCALRAAPYNDVILCKRTYLFKVRDFSTVDSGVGCLILARPFPEVAGSNPGGVMKIVFACTMVVHI